MNLDPDITEDIETIPQNTNINEHYTVRSKVIPTIPVPQPDLLIK